MVIGLSSIGREYIDYIESVLQKRALIVRRRGNVLYLPELNITIRPSYRSKYPILRIRDDDEAFDIVCYLSMKTLRYTCRRIRLVGRQLPLDYQAHYSLIFEACYAKKTAEGWRGTRRGRGATKRDNLHVECHATALFTIRELNKYIRDYVRKEKLAGFDTIIAVIDYLLELKDKLADCCYNGCLREYFDSSKSGSGEAPDVILEGSVQHFAIYSLNRLSDACFMDRCYGEDRVSFDFQCVE